MHKTGTSSIQQTLSKIHRPDFCYPKWRNPNHSNLFALLYHEPLTEYHAFKNEGISEKALKELKKESLAKFEEELYCTNHKKIIFSAEDISGIRYQKATERFRDHLKEMNIPYKVILYVRPPRALIQSSVQQLIKSGLADDNLSIYWPNYRKRLEYLDKLFGKANVTLRKFSKNSLYEGDVVKDFARVADLAINNEKIIKANESLSLEATAFLYIQRKYGSGYLTGFPGAQRLNQLFIQELKQIGSRKFTISPTIINPIIKKNIQDIKWLEGRMDQAMIDDDCVTGDEIESFEELESIGIECYEDINKLIEKRISSSQRIKLKGLIANIEALKSHVYSFASKL